MLRDGEQTLQSCILPMKNNDLAQMLDDLGINQARSRCYLWVENEKEYARKGVLKEFKIK